MNCPIEDYALLGDGETAALLSRDGSIDWLCWPRFDDDACFAALLGSPDNGYWSIAPVDPIVRRRWRYQRDTLIMESDFETASGAVRLTDFMPMRQSAPRIVRIVRGLRGTVTMRCELRLRFDYGKVQPWTKLHGNKMVAIVGPDLVTLHSPVELNATASSTEAQFRIRAGERQPFVLSYGRSHRNPPARIDADEALSRTQVFWRDWIGRFDSAKTEWPDEVRRSLITLKALIHEPTGGLVAAPTTSLPELPGGRMNWDYRYCWLRDASFTLGALMNAGFHSEASAWRDWLLRAIGGSPELIRIMYRVDGARHLIEWTADHLPGYGHARPVRIGNAASNQNQVDIFGEILDCLDLARRGGIASSSREVDMESQLIDYLAKIWQKKGSGVWETRGELRHHTYSKVMAWVGVDRYVRQYGQAGIRSDAKIKQLLGLRETIREQILKRSWNERVGSFTQHYGGKKVDASLLLLPLVGFISARDPRMKSTIDVIARTLSEGGLIRRMPARSGGPNEGTFIACSCWMAMCLHLQGRHQQARRQFERVLAVQSDLGLFAEQYNVPRKCMAGNFPQALTHVAIVNTALSLGETGVRRGSRQQR